MFVLILHSTISLVVVVVVVSSVGLLVHFGAVVADAPSPLSTPRSATGQAQLRLGKPLRMKCRASPVLLVMRAGRVVAGSVGIAQATVPFHGEHDALEPTKVKRGQGGGARKRARSRTLTPPPAPLFPGTAGPSEPTLAAVPDGALLPSGSLPISRQARRPKQRLSGPI